MNLNDSEILFSDDDIFVIPTDGKTCHNKTDNLNVLRNVALYISSIIDALDKKLNNFINNINKRFDDIEKKMNEIKANNNLLGEKISLLKTDINTTNRSNDCIGKRD
uniref:t-SNARE coiled-coil homology domain-containing protein n=1 Tax=Strongyloides venezuelensis TaxID=75913 RepID=A0A0K0G0C6_STRVS